MNLTNMRSTNPAIGVMNRAAGTFNFGGEGAEANAATVSGTTTKALVLMDNGKVYGCALTPRTIAQRIQTTANLEGETDDEAAEPEREDSEAD